MNSLEYGSVDEFPKNATEAQHIARAFARIESKKMDLKLQENNILRDKAPNIQEREIPFFRLVSLAASIVLLVGALFFWQNRVLSPQELAASNLESIGADYNPTLRSASEVNHYELGNRAFAAEDWPTAKSEYGLASEQESNQTPEVQEQIRFYQGLVSIKLANYPEAIAFLSASLNTKAGNYDKDARWMRALCYIKSNQLVAAKADLEKTAAVSDWKKAKDAQKILDALNR